MITPTPSSRLARLTRAALPAAPLALGAVPSAQAVIIYTNPIDITFASTDNKYIWVDMGTGGANGAAALGNPGTPSVSSPTFYLWFRAYGSIFQPEWVSNNNPTFSGDNRVSTFSYTNRIRNLAEGTTINSTVANTGNYSLFNNLAGFNDANWAPGTTGYIGVFFDSDATTPLLGWVRLTYNIDKSVTLHDFAYESSGGSILAGAGAVPEPSTYALMAGLLAGSAALYRRRQKAKAA